MNEEYTFPPVLEQDFRDACDYFDIDEEMTEYVLARIDFPVYDAYLVPKHLSGDERMREFVAIAFNTLNRDLELGYEELPLADPDIDIYGECSESWF